MAHVVSIVYRPKGTRRPQDRYERVPIERVRLVEFRGIAGDMKGSSTNRQLNVMCAETLAELGAEGFRVGPGELGEQIVVAGLDPAALAPGTRVRLNSAVIEVVEPRTGCARFEAIQGKPRGDVVGRLGVIARVVSGGEVAVGDAVEVLPAE
ncbi:MOSC domain-containing protein [Frigoriglobus tundricola]|uniref:MOSC domain protein n=1 Tax=Frigoriglobus tundricola TaxID=2774151 RepID=A0A6M5YX73_9BACT|nr:MOSC domain-containing protein [Frigoriglobus tundricola]QJW97542.1 MOSC domain protein [Frigoriglobus tundricola]